MHKRIAVFGLAAFAALAFAGATLAVTPIVVTPTNAQGWSTADTRPGGAVNFVVDATSPAPGGALQLTTDSTTTAKAQYLHSANVALASVNELSYQTKQVSAAFAGGDASYQLVVCLGGVTGTTCNGFTTFVYEPYQNDLVAAGVWQSWDVDAGQMWSSRSYNSGTCVVTAGGGGTPFYTLSGLQAACPSAMAVGFGVNVGVNNPSYVVETDLVSFNGQAYDFELYQVARSKGQCKDSGWMSVTRTDGSAFKNQGDCVQYVNTGK